MQEPHQASIKICFFIILIIHLPKTAPFIESLKKDGSMRLCSIVIGLSLCISNIVTTQASAQDLQSITADTVHRLILATFTMVTQSFAQQSSLYTLWSKNLETFKQALSDSEMERDDIFDNIREMASDAAWCHTLSKTVLLRPGIEDILTDVQKECDAKIDYLMSLVTYLTKEIEQLYVRYQTSTQQEKNRYQEIKEHLAALHVQHDHMLYAQTQFTKNLQEFADFLYIYLAIACEETRDLEHFFFEDQESCQFYSPCIQESIDFATDLSEPN